MQQTRPRIKIHFDKIKADRNSALGLIFDSFMIGVVFISLVWMIIDWHFIGGFTRNTINDWFPTFFNWYDKEIHPNYLFYDSIFIVIFLIELLVRWGVSIVKKRYYKWWFHPFVHWYDVLGCIPVGAFRVLRFVRVYSMVIRLNKKGFIDIKHTALYRLFKRNTDVVFEEVADRVVDNVLAGVQEEVYADSKSMTKIIQDVIRPQQEELVKWIAIKVQLGNQMFYERFHKDIEVYLKKNIELAVENNSEIKRIDRIPLLGKQITETLQHSISDITFNVINNTIKDLAEQNKEDQLNELTNIAFEVILTDEKEDKRLEMVVKDMIVKSIDVVREQVAEKQWKAKVRI